MTERWLDDSRWGRWATGWFPVCLLAALWTLLTVPSSGIIAAFLFFGFCLVLGVGIARDSGGAVPWSAAPSAAGALTALSGSLYSWPGATLLVIGAMVVTSPWVRSVCARQRAAADLAELSDWRLETLWYDTEAELRRAGRPDQRLAVVQQRAKILDELVRRTGEPGRASPLR